MPRELHQNCAKRGRGRGGRFQIALSPIPSTRSGGSIFREKFAPPPLVRPCCACDFSGESRVFVCGGLDASATVRSSLSGKIRPPFTPTPSRKFGGPGSVIRRRVPRWWADYLLDFTVWVGAPCVRKTNLFITPRWGWQHKTKVNSAQNEGPINAESATEDPFPHRALHKCGRRSYPVDLC